RLRLQFDYPPPATPHCTAFWLLVDLNNLTSLIHQRFSCSSGDLLGLYLERGLLPRGESVRLVRDNCCLRVKLEERGVKSKKRAFQLEDEETEPDYRYSKEHRKRQENNNNNEKVLDLEPKAVTDQTVSQKKKKEKKIKQPVAQRVITKRPKENQQRKKRKVNIKKKGEESQKQPVKAKSKGSVSICSKESPISSLASESCDESISDGPSKVTLEARNSSEKLPTELSKEGPSTKNTTADKLGIKSGFSLTPSKDKTSGTTSSISDCSSESDDQCLMSSSTLECAAGFLKTVGLFAGRGCPGPELSSHTAGAAGWRYSGSNGGGQAPGPSPSVSLPTSLGRGWGRGENLFSWKGARGRGISTDHQRQQQLSDMVTNSSIIQNPVKTHKDYTAAPQVGEKTAFKLLELTSRRILNTQILPSLPALREPGKFDLVYHNENRTEVVEYAVTQESKITVFWRELIDPRLIIESPSNTSSTEPA
uniref:Coilin N-terminal domain-containing protein n=1 Tax=Macaca nemestrina TaxID=9545 RepID=A0A2K6DJ05_MACNE